MLKDNTTDGVLAQIKFKSISPKEIKAVKVHIDAFGVSGEALEGVEEYPYLDLTVKRNSEFGQKQAVNLPDKFTRSFAVSCTEIIFADGTTWMTPEGATWTPLPKRKALTNRLSNAMAEQYKRDIPDAQYVPEAYSDLWFCTCGGINHSEEAGCNKCGTRKDKQFSALDENTLAEHKTAYDAEQAEKKTQREAEEKARREQAEAQRRAAAKKAKKTAAIVIPIIVVVVAAFLVVTKVIIPNNKYNAAVALMDAGEYDAAISAFEAMDEYKDSADKISECNDALTEITYQDAVALMDAGEYDAAIHAFRLLGAYKDAKSKIGECNDALLEMATEAAYQDAVVLLDAGEYQAAVVAFETLGDYKDSEEKLADAKHGVLKASKVGDIVTFGTYEQDSDTTNGKEEIEWLMLAVENGKALLISKYCLDCQPYNTEREDITWEKCTLRVWLNDDFLNAAFSAEEQELILTSYIKNEDSPKYGTSGGYDTMDKVFLLSIGEAKKYFSTDTDRRAASTKYAIAHGAWMSDSEKTESGEAICSWWWLRSPGYDSTYAASVVDVGFVYGLGGDVDVVIGAVRPALWIDLSK